MVAHLDERNELDYNKPAWCTSTNDEIIIEKDFDILTFMIFITMAY